MSAHRRQRAVALLGQPEPGGSIAQTANCRCGETLDFGTDGMGRLVEWCPCCDGGQRPSRTRPAFTVRRCARCTIPIAEGLPASVTMCTPCRNQSSRPMRACVDCGRPSVGTRCGMCRPAFNRAQSNVRMREAR